MKLQCASSGLLLLFFFFLQRSVHAAIYESCTDVKMKAPGAASGIFTVQTPGFDSLSVFCFFSEINAGFMFLDPAAIHPALNIDIHRLYNDGSKIMVLCVTQSANFMESIIQQVPKFASTPIGISLFSTAPNYASNTLWKSQGNLRLFAGMIPMYNITTGTVNGYVSNGVNCSFANCDTNPRSHWTQFYNATGTALPQRVHNGLASKWVSSFKSHTGGVPLSYHTLMDSGFGGCGYYIYMSPNNYCNAGAIGLRFSWTNTTQTTMPSTTQPTEGRTLLGAQTSHVSTRQTDKQTTEKSTVAETTVPSTKRYTTQPTFTETESTRTSEQTAKLSTWKTTELQTTVYTTTDGSETTVQSGNPTSTNVLSAISATSKGTGSQTTKGAVATSRKTRQTGRHTLSAVPWTFGTAQKRGQQTSVAVYAPTLSSHSAKKHIISTQTPVHGTNSAITKRNIVTTEENPFTVTNIHVNASYSYKASQFTNITVRSTINSTFTKMWTTGNSHIQKSSTTDVLQKYKLEELSERALFVHEAVSVSIGSLGLIIIVSCALFIFSLDSRRLYRDMKTCVTLNMASMCRCTRIRNSPVERINLQDCSIQAV